MIALWHISNLLTYVGIASSIVGMCFAASGHPGLAMVLLILTGLCDLFDGAFARRCKRTEAERNFGVQIDSLADVLGFAALPSMILHAAGLSAWWFWPVMAVYVIAAASRLAFFNVSLIGKDSSVPVPYFVGLPVTYSALIWPLFWLLSYWIAPSLYVWILAAVALLLAFLFVFDFKNRKPGGIFYAIFAVAALLVATVILFMELAL